MCRFFAYISDSEPCLLEDVLVRPSHSIVKQVQEHYLPGLFHHVNKEEDEAQRRELAIRNLHFNNDGTGVVLYSSVATEFGEATGITPLCYKTTMAPTNDMNFSSLCHNTSSLCVFAHVRMATSEVSQYNSHPFLFGRHSFMHNGSITNFNLIRRDLCCKLSPKAYANVKGTTDSEHLAALYFTHLGDDWDAEYSLEEMKSSLERAIADVIQLQRDLPGASTPLTASSLNLCTTDGLRLLAFRFRNSDIGEPPSLYVSTLAGVTLNRKYPGHPNCLRGEDPGEEARGLVGEATLDPEAHGNHVIVASEPTTRDQDEWELVPKNKAVMVDFPEGKNRVKIVDIVLS